MIDFRRVGPWMLAGFLLGAIGFCAFTDYVDHGLVGTSQIPDYRP